MNTEVNKEAQEQKKFNKSHGAKGSKQRPGPKRRALKPSAVYGDEELLAAEGEPFWNAVHDAKIKSRASDGLSVAIERDGGALEVFVPDEELSAGADRQPGQSIRIYLEDAIDADKDSDRPFRGSEIKAVELDLLHKVQEALDKNQAVKGVVVGEIKGGYSVALFAEDEKSADQGFGLRAFLPLGRSGIRRGESPGDLEGQPVDLRIAELDPVRGNIVVSRREVLQKERQKEQETFFSQHEVGDVVSGLVSAVMPYGVFVDLGGVDGFLHSSDVSWDKRPKLKELVPIGKEIEAKIIGMDPENKKIKLSIKDLNRDPWQAIEKTFKPGSEVEGDIVAFAEFGAFVRLKDGVEGLIHLGEITWNRIKHPSQYFKIGDQVTAAVLRVDKDQRRISLSTKALEQSPVERLSGQFPIGTVIKTKVASIHEFGLFVELDEQSNGLVPRSEVSWVRSDEPLEKQFSVAQEIEVAVLGYDSNRQRVSCSIKRLQEDPWPKWKANYRKGTNHKVKVIAVKSAGVVCRLDGDLTGFCPKSQLAESEGEQRVNVKVGDEIEVVITEIDLNRQRISFSQKAALESETKKAYQSYLSEQGKGGASKATLADALRNRLKDKD